MTASAIMLVTLLGMGAAIGDAPPGDPSEPAKEAPSATPTPPSAAPPPAAGEAPDGSDRRVPSGEAPAPSSDGVGIERLDPLPMAGVQVGAGVLTLIGAGAVA